jgi:hypothetical protein
MGSHCSSRGEEHLSAVYGWGNGGASSPGESSGLARTRSIIKMANKALAGIYKA